MQEFIRLTISWHSSKFTNISLDGSLFILQVNYTGRNHKSGATICEKIVPALVKSVKARPGM